MAINLDSKVLSMLNAKKGDWQAISEAAGVSYSWLSKFANGHIPNPGYVTLRKLHDTLSSKRRATPTTEGA